MTTAHDDDRWRSAEEMAAERRMSGRRVRGAYGSPEIRCGCRARPPLAEARARSEGDWRHALSDRAQFVAESDGGEVGMLDPERGGVHLISMWVAPRARGTGVPDRPVRAVLDWAVEGGHDVVRLEFAEHNAFAERLYPRNGFARSGAVDRSPRTGLPFHPQGIRAATASGTSVPHRDAEHRRQP
ncbi:GNAT family N-acetyltransferase [Nocardia niwae]|uniref:GNAT family N-acetyltransferase n=1 Tax=Nocardia niwae TaxID=626084 RepID=UPI00340EA7BC